VSLLKAVRTGKLVLTARSIFAIDTTGVSEPHPDPTLMKWREWFPLMKEGQKEVLIEALH
jgi:hypothetical protein